MAGIAINGLGRIGRAALKVLEQAAEEVNDEVNDAFREEAASDRYRGILGVADDRVVPADIIGVPRAPVVDAAMARMVDQTLVKVMTWYDNEWGFTCRMTRGAFTALGLPAPDLAQVRP